jgi:hypothetical protein
MKTYYQPIDRNGNLPEELPSFMAFDTREHCLAWMEDNLYPEDEYPIHEFHDDDIKAVTLIDEIGNYLDGTGSLGCYNTERELTEGYNMLQDTIKLAMAKSGEKRLFLMNFSCILYEDYNTLGLYEPSEFGDECPEIVSIDLAYAYDTDSEFIPLENITDFDDFVMLNDAICQAYEV